MSRLPIIGSAIAATLFLVGCGGAETASQAGFLGNYSQLDADPTGKSDRIYLSASRSLGDYDKFLVEPVVVHFAANAEGTSSRRPSTRK